MAVIDPSKSQRAELLSLPRILRINDVLKKSKKGEKIKEGRKGNEKDTAVVISQLFKLRNRRSRLRRLCCWNWQSS